LSCVRAARSSLSSSRGPYDQPEAIRSSEGGVPTVGKRDKWPDHPVVVRCIGEPHSWRWQVGRAERDHGHTDAAGIDMPAFSPSTRVVSVCDLLHRHPFSGWLVCSCPLSNKPRPCPRSSNVRRNAVLSQETAHVSIAVAVVLHRPAAMAVAGAGAAKARPRAHSRKQHRFPANQEMPCLPA
jgi:hypothetical protein